jgi:peptide/nickel transport system substrate-binding protein
MALAAATAIVVAACGGGGGGGGSQATGTPAGGFQKGGILKGGFASDVHHAFDPQKEYYTIGFEFFRCCLNRTLMSYAPATADKGGNVPVPDLADGQPQVSADGLTWTFKIRSGVHYSPPLQDVEVTSGDFVRALTRMADADASAGGYPFYYSPIVGFDDYTNGKAQTVTGLETPDDQTLVIHLTTPTGDLSYRLAMPAAGPIPPNPNNPSAKYGIADGHTTDYGRFVVGTGPYMFKGTDQLDFTKPADQQRPATGYEPGKSIVLVRNPSWDAATDPLRNAYLDGIEVTIGGEVADLENKIQNGELDFMDQAPLAQAVQAYSTNPDLKPFLHSDPTAGNWYVMMKLGSPPFDDIHVRKAVNWVIDKAGLLQLAGGPLFGQLAGHIIPNGLLNGLLDDYDPYATPDSKGDANKAMEEMKQSKYDTDKDGVCDAPECKNVLTAIDQTDPVPRESALIQQNLEQIGITLNMQSFETTTMYTKCEDAKEHVAFCTAEGWYKDFADAVTFGPPLFGSASLTPSCCNDALVGASADELTEWGYPVTSVPSADSVLDKCPPLAGDARYQCWADADKYLMEQIVPWAPYRFANQVQVFSTRVQNYVFDDFAGFVAIDQLALKNGGQ